MNQNINYENAIYLDNNATTKVAPEVLEEMLPFFKDMYGNPSSIHKFGGSIKKYVDTARTKVAKLINAEPEEIIFTSCGTESNNTVIQGHVEKFGEKAKIITTAVEHPAVLNTCKAMEKRGANVKFLNVDSEGMLDIEDLANEEIDQYTLVTTMWANNETGVIFPIEQIANLVKERGGIFHTDAVQAAGKIPINVKQIPIDMLSISGHKLHAPKGIGILYIKKGIKLPPLLLGGHQEKGFRAGTENVPYIVGLGKAAELALDNMEKENTYVKSLRDRLEKGLLVSCKGAKLNGHKEQRLPNTTNISFEFIEGEAILLYLDEYDIAASSGSACTTGSLEPSHVMRAMGIPYTFAHSSIRFSFSRYNKESDVDKVLEVMPGIIDTLRQISPFVKE